MTHPNLEIFQRNDINKLYSLTKKLWSRGAFKYYLNNQQLLVLQCILEDQSDPKSLFMAFMTSGVSFKFVEKNQKKDVPQGDINYNESTIANGPDAARQLALKIRYILWDKAIDFYYQDKEEDLQEYELFEEDEKEPTQEIETTEAETKSPKEPETVTKQGRSIDEDEDYDDDDEEEEEDEIEKESKKEPDTKEEEPQFQKDEQGNIILEVPIVDNDEDLHQLDNKILTSNFNKIYHNFEHDKETLIKRQKLAENDKLLEENEEEEHQHLSSNGKAGKESSKGKDSLSMNLGAANLSLKHLLRSIDQNKSKLDITDAELRQLIMDVRKNRSKWASDDKIGQEELYEACEKVVMELRGYTEHSTAFLNKVSKREAPNYYQIIKKPMDLNTILKKLKSFQYKSKQQFVEDVMLIWKNCLTYNTEPKHFLRIHAIAMQKKSMSLIPLIPDITVKDRSEVEAAFKDQEESSTPASLGAGGKNTAGKGKKRSRNGEVLEREEETKDETEDQISSVAESINTTMVADGTQIEDDDNEGDSNEYLNVEDMDKDDLETQTWKNLTSKARADYCIARSLLFTSPKKEEKPEVEQEPKKEQIKEPLHLNEDADALVRDKKNMREFDKYLGRDYEELYEEQQEEDLDNVGKTAKDKDPYLMEYDVSSGVPEIPYSGLSSLDLDQEEQKLVEQVLAQGLQPSCYSSQGEKGLNGVINGNIEIMQDIRRLCYKISLIRQMQQNQFVHHTQMRPPQLDPIDDSVDLDPVSRLPNREKHGKLVVFNVLRKRVAKIAMQNGFESTESFAIDTLTQITGDYMNNLIRTIKTHLETPSVNKQQKQRNVLRLALLQNGIMKPDDLYVYVHENILRQSVKLRDLKGKLSGFLKSLLRPAIQDLSESAFQDNSEQFLNGDFSNEIGDDFFGFKELGLDKELGVLGNTIPLHLLQSRFADQSGPEVNGKASREPFEMARELPLEEKDIEKEIGLFQKFLLDVLQKTKVHNSKQYKTKREMNEYIATAKELTLLEDEDYPKKSANKSKLPPNGKIQSSLKKKLSNVAYFIPEEEELLEPIKIKSVKENTKLNNNKKKTNTKPQQPAKKEDINYDSGSDEDENIKSEGVSMFSNSSAGTLAPIVEGVNMR